MDEPEKVIETAVGAESGELLDGPLDDVSGGGEQLLLQILQTTYSVGQRDPFKDGTPLVQIPYQGRGTS